MAKKGKRKHNIDFTGVEAYNKPAEGSHKVKIDKVEEKVSQGGNDMFVVTFEVTAGASKGCKCNENYPLIDTALWKLKSLLQSVGMKAEGRVQVDLDKLVGKTLEIQVGYEEYNGQDRARVLETRKLSAKKDSEEELEDEIEEDDIDDEEDNEVEEDTEESEEEEEEEKKTKKSSKKNTKKSAKSSKKASGKKSKKEPEPEPEDDDDWDDEDDDEDWDEE